MEHLRLIEEDLRNLGLECQRKYPEVGEASQKALDSLKVVRELYVNTLRKNVGSSDSPKLPESADLVSPYILLCNHADCSSKLIGQALSGLQSLLTYGVVPVSEVQNVVRVLSIQAIGGKSDSHLRVIQILVGLAMLTVRDDVVFRQCSDQTLSALLSALLVFCEARHGATVVSAASGSVRQVAAALAEKTFALERLTEDSTFLCKRLRVLFGEVCGALAMSLQETPRGPVCLLSLDILGALLDLSPPLRGSSLDQLLESEVRETLWPLLRRLLRGLGGDYLASAGRGGAGVAVANGVVSRALSLARKILVARSALGDSEQQEAAGYLLSALQPLRDAVREVADPRAIVAPRSTRGSGLSGPEGAEASSIRAKLDEASALLVPQMASSLLFRFSTVLSAAGSAASGKTSAAQSERPPFLLVSFSGGGSEEAGEDKGVLPLFLALACLDLLLALLVARLTPAQLRARPESATQLLQSLLAACCCAVHHVLASGCDVKDLEHEARGSLLHTLLHSHWCDGECRLLSPSSSLLWDTVHTFVHSTAQSGVYPGDVFVLCVAMLQAGIKLACSLCLLNHALDPRIPLLVSPLLLSSFKAQAEQGALDTQVLSRALSTCLDGVYEPLLDCASSLLRLCQSIAMQRCVIQSVSELSVCCAALGLSKPSQIVLSFMCKHALPLWHGAELVENNKKTAALPREDPAATLPTLKWRHTYMLTRLLQVLHVTSDCVSDWDCIVDCLEQAAFAAGVRYIPDAPSNSSVAHFRAAFLLGEAGKFEAALSRFVNYSVFFSSDTLIRLMSSLVALSSNHVAIFSTSLLGDVRGLQGTSGTSGAPGDRDDGDKGSGSLSSLPYSLRSVVEASKANAFRIALIWQMALSHLRMVTSSKARFKRDFAVEATFDILACSLARGVDSVTVGGEVLVDDFNNSAVIVSSVDQQGLLLAFPPLESLLPSLDSVFFPRDYHKLAAERAGSGEGGPQLSQADLLESLLSLSSSRFDDVRLSLLKGLGAFVRKVGHLLGGGEGGGWRVVLE
eukprot:gene30660-37048_t